MKRDTIVFIVGALAPIYKLSSATKIAEFLKEQKIKGDVSSDSCPLARWGAKAVAKSKADVNFDGENYEFTVEDGENITVDGTVAMKQFAENFDDDKYLDLIDPVENYDALDRAKGRVQEGFLNKHGIHTVSIDDDVYKVGNRLYSSLSIILHVDPTKIKNAQAVVEKIEKRSMPFKVKVESTELPTETQAINEVKPMIAKAKTKKVTKKAKKAKNK